jgi:hypothetical protein
MRSARHLAALALVGGGVLVVAQCGGEVATPASFEAVLGVEADCASRVRAISIDVRAAGQVELSRSFAVESLAELPVAVPLPSLAGGQAQHEVRVAFRLDAAEAGAAPTITSIGPYHYDDGTSGRVLYVLPCTCIGITCPAGESCAELPAGSGRAVCQKPPTCGDRTCDPGEPVTCPGDCAATCSGDGHCDEGESCASCPLDCGFCCGDGACEGGETAASCPSDCAPGHPPCGDGKCDAGEDCASCAADCCCSDPCCLMPGPCCGSTDPCCGSADPCCGKLGDGAPCVASAACCSGACNAAVCGPPCGPDGASCAGAASCCGGLCNGGLCASPPPRVTQVVVNAANGVDTPAFASTAQLFFITAADGTWDEAKSLRLPFPNTGGQVDLLFDFGAHAQWTGTIVGLRFDPFDCGASPLCDSACFNVADLQLRDALGAPVPALRWTFDGSPVTPVPSPFFGWELANMERTWTDGATFGGCVGPTAAVYGDPLIRNAALSFAVQP